VARRASGDALPVKQKRDVPLAGMDVNRFKKETIKQC
jgi:hypothetical protein